MKKKSTLADALLQQSDPVDQHEKAPSKQSTSHSYVAPVRRGKKAVTGWIHKMSNACADSFGRFIK